MACRRTRIKGIANIPQRRKTSNGTTSEDRVEVSELEDIGNSEHNLNLEHETSPGENITCETPKIDTASSEVNNEILINGGCQLQEDLLTDESLQKGTSPDLPIESANLQQKPAVPVRRRFIKPAVSVNAINRKVKDTEEAKPVVPTTPVNGRNNKIVILNEIITYPNLSKPILIQNHKSDDDTLRAGVVPETGNNLLKSVEVNGGKQTSGNSLERDIKRLVPTSPQILIPDVEYPIPPPSPNKINRSRIKAIPRLGQRNTSFSASESEDESRRNYRHRNDSVCSSTSGLQDTNSVLECPSPQKPREFNSVIQRKCRRTEQSRKLAEARRDFYMKFGNKKPDRQKLTMIDLIFYNPVTNPMTGDEKAKRKMSETVENETLPEQKPKEEETVDDPAKTGSDEENEIPAPQIKIGPQGELVVDEQSLVIENKNLKKNREELEKSAVVNGDFETCYGIYKRAKRSKDWSKQETLKFYKALNTIGTDFALMCELFPRRSRRELKMKFKKEERVNKTLIDKAIMQPCNFDFNDFKHEVEMEEKELQELEKQKEREKTMKQEAKKRKAAPSLAKELPENQQKTEKPKAKKKKRTLDILNVLEDDSDADESEVESMEADDTQDTLLRSIQRPTRSGRVPKLLHRYKAPEPESKGKAQPGSLIVVASTGPNGQPVYKVCMVTGEHGRQQIGDDMNSLEKALECQENGITSLFTLTATPAEEHNETISEEEHNETISEEHNTTIPAGEEIYNGNLQEVNMEV